MDAHIEFARADLSNTSVLDTVSGKVLYEIKTTFDRDSEPNAGRFTTSLIDREGATVAVWQPKWAKEPSRVTVRGKTIPLIEWLTFTSGLTTSRKFRAPNGRTYLWKESMFGKSLNKLVDAEANCTVATVHNQYSLSFSGSKTRIDYKSELASILDAVVLSFVIGSSSRQASSLSAKRGVYVGELGTTMVS